MATLARNARARGTSGVRAASTLFCFCRRAAWSRLLDISVIPNSCAETTSARVRNKNITMEEEPTGEKRRNENSKREGDPWIDPSSISRSKRGTGHGRAHLQVLEVLEDPLPALLLVGRAGGGCAARFRRHVPAALPPPPPLSPPSFPHSAREWSEWCVWLFRIPF